MRNPQLLDLYTDFCLTSFSAVTATGLSKLLDDGYSHDQISRFLSQKELGQKDFWKLVKPLIRKIESDFGVINIDDTISEKPHSTENEMICYHFDHSKGKSVKGINLLNFTYHTVLEDGQDVTLPVAYEIIRKSEKFVDSKTGKVKRRSEVTKNELVRNRLFVLCKHNRIKFRYVLWDSWFSSKENFDFVHFTLKKYFIGALKSNRLVAVSEADKKQGKYIKVTELDFQSNPQQVVWLKGLAFPMLLAKQVFKNKDGSTGELYLITNDLDLSASDLFITYQRRWSVEVFHKSLKQNAALEKSPTKYEVTQSNHIFASMIAYCKLEILKVKEHSNHFALKARLYLKAVKAAYEELAKIKNANFISAANCNPIPLLG